VPDGVALNITPSCVQPTGTDEKVGDVLTDDNLQTIWRSSSGQ
jgi:hypothetical protein